MQAFIQASDVGSNKPIVVLAFYEDASVVPADAHGKNTMIINVPRTLINIDPADGMFKIPADWRYRVHTATMMQGEARRRAELAFPADQRAAALYEVLSYVIKHGTDVNGWPREAHERWNDLDRRFKYVQEVHQRAETFTEIPHHPTSDELWPTRI